MSKRWERQLFSVSCFNSVVSVIFILCASEVCYAQWWRTKSNPFGMTETSESRIEPAKNVGIPFQPDKITSPPSVVGETGDQLLYIFGTPEPASDVAVQSLGTAHENCMCVPFFQCYENGSINTAGDGIFEVKVRLPDGLDPDPIFNVDICPSTDENSPHKCCKLPFGYELPHPAQTPSPGVRDTSATSYTSFPNGYQTDGLNQKLFSDSYTPSPEAPSRKPCGMRAGYDVSSDLLRLSNPDETSFGEFPWMLALLGPNEDANGGAGSIGNIFQCGASLIHPQVALTAAHCIKNPKSQSYVIRAGEYDTSGMVEALPHQDRLVSSILIPANFNTRTLYNDVALLVLEEPITPADNVGTICMPDEGAVYDAKWCVATGWGRATPDRNSSPTSVLKKIDVYITPSKQCQNELRRTRLGLFFLLDPSFICAGGQRNQDTCQGDGGGPVACSKKDSASPYDLVGVTAWGVGCGSSTPAVYASVVSQRQWVSDRFADMGFAFDEPL